MKLKLFVPTVIVLKLFLCLLKLFINLIRFFDNQSKSLDYGHPFHYSGRSLQTIYFL